MQDDALSSCHLHRPRRLYRGELLMPPLHPTGPSLVHSLIALTLEILHAQNGNSSCAQKRNLSALSRRLKVLLLFLEELRDTPSTCANLPPSAFLCFSELHVAFQGIKLLSQDCAESSRMSLLMDHRRLSEFFHRLTLDMATALEILPLTLLGDVSSEMREQVELAAKQGKRAKLYVDGKESRLYAEVRRAMAQIERKEAPEAWRLAEIFNGLELRNGEDCEREIEKLQSEQEEEEEEERWDAALRQRVEERRVPLSDLISFVRYGKCVLYGASEAASGSLVAKMRDMATAAVAEESEEIAIPDDFRCPISLELMRDPVIVATGQTYERSAISHWIARNRTCPKSGLPLLHNTLIPNCALRSLIRRWCTQNNVLSYLEGSMPSDSSCPQHRRSSSPAPSTPTALEATKLTAELLLRQLPSAPPDTQRRIAGELRVLTKCSSDNRKVVADAGAIPALVPFLSVPDSPTQENAMGAILNLSVYPPNKHQIVQSGALDHVVTLLQSGSRQEVRERAATVLFSLSQVTEAAAEMGRKAEAVSGLLQIVKEGSAQGRRDAASAIFNMAVYEPNRAVLVRAGAVEAVVEAMASRPALGRSEMEREAMAVLAVLAHTREGRRAFLKMEAALPMLVEVLRAGSPKARENAAAAMVCLCRHGESGGFIARVLSLQGVLLSIRSLSSHGTPRARRKAASLLRILLR